MREIKEIHIHCSATREGHAITADEIRKWHTSPPRSWSDIGYHYIVGFQQLEFGRPLHRMPASAKGRDSCHAQLYQGTPFVAYCLLSYVLVGQSS